MKVCYFGISDPNYSRNRVILQGLRQNGIDVVECNAYSVLPREPAMSSLAYVKKYVQLMMHHAGLNYDVLIASYTGQIVMPLLKFITREPVVLDAYLGMYEMFIDYEPEKGNSHSAKAWYHLDRYSFRSANLILADTQQHIKYFHEQFGTDRNKFRRIFVGSDDKIFFPRLGDKLKNDKFVVLFWGTFVPLQGVEHIIRAAKLLEDHKDIAFEIMGYGHTFSYVRGLCEQLELRNVSFFTKWIPYEKLPNYVAKADVCLGIFGGTPKAKRVIPNKAFESLAMEKPLITGDSLAAREAFAHMKNCILCEMGSPKEIAKSIMLLKDDEKLRKEIAKNGYKLFKERFTPKAIGGELKAYLNELA